MRKLLSRIRLKGSGIHLHNVLAFGSSIDIDTGGSEPTTHFFLLRSDIDRALEEMKQRVAAGTAPLKHMPAYSGKGYGRNGLIYSGDSAEIALLKKVLDDLSIAYWHGTVDGFYQHIEQLGSRKYL
jgi:hypothetical protein